MPPTITRLEAKRIHHRKADEQYISVRFDYGSSQWVGFVPVEYRRTGISIEHTAEAEEKYLKQVFQQMHPDNHIQWAVEQDEFWRVKRPGPTKDFFDALKVGRWLCVKCQLPANPNWARRVQDLKEFGYTIATDINRFCETCNTKRTALIMLLIPRAEIAGNGYETWSPALRKRIIKVLGGREVFENKAKPSLLPDHKFSEIRWDSETKAENPESMTDEEIRDKFQLLTNQHNQQKREACRTCLQTGKRQRIYDIEFFYEGTVEWDVTIPKKGKAAEKGCIGCPWYDIQRWRTEVQKRLNS